jgi:hypothetical protein
MAGFTPGSRLVVPAANIAMEVQFVEGKAFREIQDNGFITSHSLTGPAFKLDGNMHCIYSHDSVFSYGKGVSKEFAKKLKPGDQLVISGVFSSAHEGPDNGLGWNLVHVYLSVGEAKVIEPGDPVPPAGAIAKTIVPAPGGTGDFLGVWSSVNRKTRKKVERIEFQSGGRWRALDAAILQNRGPNTYQVDGDKLILTMAEFGTATAEIAEVRWIDENSFEYTILQGMVAGRSLRRGEVYLFHRQPRKR